MISRRGLLGIGAAALGLAVLPGGPVGAADRVPWDRLAARLRGRLVLPSDAAYPVAKQLELAQFDGVDPSAIAYCVSTSDVVAAVRFARDHGVPVAVRSGGHNYGGYSTTPGLIIDVFRLNAVTVGDGTVSIGPGAQNVEIVNALAPYGLAFSGGGYPTVAAGGFLQGGGFGLLTRTLGMACDAVTSAEVVLADGSVVTASASRHSDLFWAARGGGGGNFGVVTSFQVTPHVGDAIASATIAFPYQNVVDVLDGFARWMVDTPRSIGGGAFIQQPDATPGSVPNLVALLASPGSAADLAAEIDRLLALTGAPVFRQDVVSSYRDLMMNVYGCANLNESQCQRSGKTPQGQLTRPAFGVERTRLGVNPYGRADWDRVVAAFDADPVAGQARYLDLHMFGGAANDPGRTDTAYVHRDAQFSVNYRVLIGDPQSATTESTTSARQWANDGFATIDPLSNGETYQNWMDPALPDWRQSYYAENYPRLRRIKARYDPDRFFTFAQGIEPETPSWNGE